MSHQQGKAHREKQLVYLKDHLDRFYYSRDRKWIVLFPEGGFLRKRRETSQSFAKKNDLPYLTHVTLPRLGATQIILKNLGPQQENGILGTEGSPTGQSKIINHLSRFKYQIPSLLLTKKLYLKKQKCFRASILVA